ncbi:MAG: tRNA (5-methylaminomethyl-2-thiouridine)(34)-methyltransferase MnmD [Pseudomonadota bacterium]
MPVSERFDDPFYSLEDGWAESHHVFVAGNDLPRRFRPGFHIAELGFGTGLNLAVTLAACPPGMSIHYTSFEAYPLSAGDARVALGAFAQTEPYRAAVSELLQAPDLRLSRDDLESQIIPGDARETLPVWQGRADAWYLDGFAPARNPELWGAELMAQIARHTAPGGSFATYTAAGHVRRALAEAGFDVTRKPGFGRKRHMSVGTLA